MNHQMRVKELYHSIDEEIWPTAFYPVINIWWCISVRIYIERILPCDQRVWRSCVLCRAWPNWRISEAFLASPVALCPPNLRRQPVSTRWVDSTNDFVYNLGSVFKKLKNQMMRIIFKFRGFTTLLRSNDAQFAFFVPHFIHIREDSAGFSSYLQFSIWKAHQIGNVRYIKDVNDSLSDNV